MRLFYVFKQLGQQPVSHFVHDFPSLGGRSEPRASTAPATQIRSQMPIAQQRAIAPKTLQPRVVGPQSIGRSAGLNVQADMEKLQISGDVQREEFKGGNGDGNGNGNGDGNGGGSGKKKIIKLKIIKDY